jgi:DNA-binding transcriptional LysR family regulator
MEIAQFRTFLTVVQTGNLSQAAQELYVSQPALSRQIQNLEKTLKVSLFERTGRGMQLTEAGRIFRNYAEHGLALIEDCQAELADLHTGNTGKISIGVGGTHTLYELPKLVRAFTKLFPRVDLIIHSGRSGEIISAVCERRIDIAFVRVPVTEPALHQITLSEEMMLLVSHPRPYKKRTKLTPAELQTAPLILFPQGASFRVQIDNALASIGVVPRIRMETDSVEEMRRFVSAGLGLAFLPHSLVKSDLQQKKLLAINVAGLPSILRRTSLIYLQERFHSMAMRNFIAVVVGEKEQVK